MKICFVNLHAYPVVCPTAPGIYGGSETRAVELANGLAQYTDHEICFVARNPHLIEPQSIAGVTWLPWRDFWTETRAHVADCLDIQALPKVRCKKWSPRLLWEIPLLAATNFWRRKERDPRRKVRVLQKIQADVYCSFGSGATSAKVCYNAHQKDSKYVMFLGSDSDLDERYRAGSTYRSPYNELGSICHWSITAADLVITQNEWQLTALEDRFQREGVYIRNPIDLKSNWNLEPDGLPFNFDIPFDEFVLWIGRADRYHKRADIALEVALRCPELNFVFVLNPREEETEQDVRSRAPDNLHIIKQVSYADMPRLFQQASVFLNTSSAHYEGFPNVFLQAGASGLPVVSLEVDAGFVNASGIGKSFAGDFEAMIAFLQQLNSDEQLRKKYGTAAREFIAQNYAADKVIAKLNQVLLEHIRTK